MSRYAFCALTRFLDGNSATVAWTMGILPAIVSPRATRSCLATASSGAMSRVTWPLLTPMAPFLPPLPDRTATSCWLATRFTCVHAFAIRGPVMILWMVLCTNPCTPLASEPETPFSNEPIRVKPFCDSSAAA